MKTELHVAIEEEQIEVVANLINNGCDVNKMDLWRNSPLHTAVDSRNSIILKLLIEAGSNVNAKDAIQGNTPLQYALDHVENAKLLLNAGADPNIKNSHGEIPLHFSVISRNFEISKLLLDAGADVNAKDENNKTALYYAVLSNNIEIIKILLAAGADANAGAAIPGHYTPMELAILTKNTYLLKMFVDAGLDLNSVNEEGDTPLRFAIENGNLNVLRMLIENGADVNAISKYNHFSPVQMAIVSRNMEVFKLLLEFSPKLNLKYENGCALLHTAAEYGNSSFVKLLIDTGANVNEKNDDEETPLHKAVHSENINIVRLLVDAGADVNGVDYIKGTPLQYAARYDNTIDIVKFLIDSKADVNMKDKEGDTALHSAAYSLQMKIIKTLIKNHADVSQCNLIGETALTILVGNFNSENTDDTFEVESILRFILQYIDVNLVHDEKNVVGKILESLQFSSEKSFLYKIILEHVAILKLLNFTVDRNLLNTIYNIDDYRKYFISCIKELKNAKNTKLRNSWVTFFDLLVDDKSKFVKYAGNEDLIDDFTKTFQNFPIYKDRMQKNVNKGVNARKLFDGAANSLTSSLPIFNPTHLIIRNILDTLNKKEWNNLCEKNDINVE